MQYHRPASLHQACELLRELGPNASVLAGGTDVLVDLRRGAKHPGHLVSLAHLTELRTIRVEGGVLRLGAMVTPSALEASEHVGRARPELLDVTRIFGSPQVRNRATVGGNLCTAASCGDLAPLLMVLDARVVVQGPESKRELALEEFYGDHRKTRLRPGEILAEIAVPVRCPGEGAAYRGFGLRAANFITVAAVAAYLRLENGLCKEAEVALGAVAPTPILVPVCRDGLHGKPPDEEAFRAAARAAREAALPISDVRGSAEHRRELVEALSLRALKTAYERALDPEVGS